MEKSREAVKLGDYFYRIRTERDIILKAASAGTPSTLARFEKGEHNLSNERLFVVMNKIGLQAEDLQNEFVRFYSPFNMVANQISEHAMNQTPAFLAEIIKQYESLADHEGKLYQLNHQVLDVRYQSRLVGKSILMSDQLENDVVTLLLRNDCWVKYDYWLLYLAAPYLSTAGLVRVCAHEAENRNTENANYAPYKNGALCQVMLTFVLRGELDQARQLKTRLVQMKMNLFWAVSTTNTTLINLISHWLDRDVPLAVKQSRSQALIETVRALEMPSMVTYLQGLTAQLTELAEGDGGNE